MAIRNVLPIIRQLRLCGWQHKPCGKTKEYWGIFTGGFRQAKEVKKRLKLLPEGLLIIFYNMIKKKTSYDPKIVALDQEQIKARKIARLQKEAEKLGCRLNIKAA